MTNVVKCISCNIIIDEMLSYIQNKISVIDEDTLMRICTSSFSSEQIVKSKELLFESVCADKIKKRKNKGKQERDLVDIINVFKSTEPDRFPIFVARDLERLPPILFDHLDCTKLLKDLLLVQNELKEVKSTCVTQNQLNEFKAEMLRMRHDSLIQDPSCKVNMKRGGWILDSGPIGLSHIHNSSINESNYDNKSVAESATVEPIIIANQFRNIVAVGEENEPVDLETVEQMQTNGFSSEQPTAGPSLTNQKQTVVTSPMPATISQPQQACNEYDQRADEKVQTNDDEGWQRVSQRRKPWKYRYLGTAGISRDSEGKFKAAEKKVPIFITKVHKATTEKDITEYVYEKTRENIALEKISFRYEREYNAYKFFVSEHKLTLFLDNKLWPQGVIFRRFVNFTQRKLNGVNSDAVSGRCSNRNG